MVKLKDPLFSLGAKGSLGDTLTFTRRRRVDIVEKKPVLPYFLTLPAQYQRWLYQDYAYLWRQQSVATKQEYATTGSRFHLTGFQYWMKYQLTNLPDISSLWHLDEISGAVAHDSGRNANNGAIIGASPASGLIDGAFLFDGLNDTVSVPLTASLIDFTEMTVELFFRAPAFTAVNREFYYASRFHASGGISIRCDLGVNWVTIFVSNSLGVGVWERWVFVPNTWYHLAFTWDGTTVHYYLDGVDSGAPDALAGTVACSSVPLTFGARPGANYYDGRLDHIILYRRALDATEILRHSLRSYPI